MPEIALNKGFIALIDDQDLSVVAGYKWYVREEPRNSYAWRHVVLPNGKLSVRLMHNILTGWSYVDHINGNGLDNRRCNLRQATNSLNQANKMKVRGTSQFKGVHGRMGKWTAQIKVQGRRRHLGSFGDEVDAAKAYDAAARESFGAFAALNFPGLGERSALTGHLVSAA